MLLTFKLDPRPETPPLPHSSSALLAAPVSAEPTPVPWVPDEDWEDNGCHQAITAIESETAAFKIEQNHIWGAGKGKSEFYRDVSWRWLAEWDAPKVEAVPSAWPGSLYCIRRLSFTVTSESKRYNNVVSGPTSVYTVLTRADNGNLFNMYPGEPAEAQTN